MFPALMTPRSRLPWLPAMAACVLGGCATAPQPERQPAGGHEVTFRKPQNPAAVRVKVSLDHRAVYVLEGDQPLLVAAVAVGKAESPTPSGRFRVTRKEARKRSNTYGFHVRGNDITSGKRASTPAGARYVGYPMPWWVEFKPGYGFHEGSVWPVPRTKGCLRLHADVAPRFFEIVPVGAPVHIARTQPEDATLGRNLARPTDYDDPDLPASYLISPAALDDLAGKRLRR